MSQDVLIIKRLRSGQPRAYADSIYEAEISCRIEGMLMDGSVFYRSFNRETIQTLTHLLIHEFVEVGAGDWASARLDVCEAVGPTQEMSDEVHPKWSPSAESRWHVIVRVPYLD